MLEIRAVAAGSVAAGLGLKPGDCVQSVDGEPVNDVIDFKYLSAEERITLVVHAREGGSRTLTLRKDPDDALGLEFAPLRIRRCRNKCIFCFVDQMPPGCRASLYVKDDDFRASFLYGNYITLGSLSEEDWRRIFDQRLSPLYVSVHATDPAVRSFIIGNKKAPDILASLRRLAAGGIRVHAQVVLVPGVNDGAILLRTLDDLAGLFPSVISIAVVPVGLTSHRNAVHPLRSFTPGESRSVIASVDAFGARMKKRYGSRLVFLSDEFFIKAKLPLPGRSYYEDYPQIENGVGMVADFMQTAARARFPKTIAPLRATLVTGVSFGAVLKRAAAKLDGVKGLSCRVVTVRNRFFGPSVTVAGLLTASDIAAGLKGKRLGDLVVIPRETLRQGENLFLDNRRLDELERKLGVPVRAAADFSELAAILKERGKRAR